MEQKVLFVIRDGLVVREEDAMRINNEEKIHM